MKGKAYFEIFVIAAGLDRDRREGGNEASLLTRRPNRFKSVGRLYANILGVSLSGKMRWQCAETVKTLPPGSFS